MMNVDAGHLRGAVRALLCFVLGVFFRIGADAAELPDLIEHIKPSIVVVGTYAKTRSPAFFMRGTGFAVAGGNLVATNAHVVPETLDNSVGEQLMIQPVSPAGLAARPARVVSLDKAHDLALLRVDGSPMPVVRLRSGALAREGQSVAFTGFPIGSALGFSPVTHRGIVSALTPIAIPGATANQLNEKIIKRLRGGAFEVYQLDATAYPGNSGGPLFETDTGEVIGIINMVFVKSTKEAVLSQPSGITFAIPIGYLQDLIEDER